MQGAVQRRGPLAHVAQAVAAGPAGRDLCRGLLIVLHAQAQARAVGEDGYCDLGGVAGVLNGVVQRYR